MTAFLDVAHVVKRYDGHVALDDVSLSVPRGSVFGLLGPNGAGKTTLLRIINRITAPDSGRVWFDGRPSAPADVGLIGYLPEERGLYKKMRVGEQAIYLAQLKGLSRREARRRLKAWFERLGILPWWGRRLEELSKGMQQKVQFVITVLHRPPLLIFDEPFSGFDPINADLLKREILALRDAGHTILFSTHNMASVEEICDHFALINGGRVVLQGQVDEVRRRFRTGLYELVATTGELRSDSTLHVESVRDEAGSRCYRLRKLTDEPNSRWLMRLAERVEVRSFAELLPTMNDIFLQTVEHGAAEAHAPKPDTP